MLCLNVFDIDFAHFRRSFGAVACTFASVAFAFVFVAFAFAGFASVFAAAFAASALAFVDFAFASAFDRPSPKRNNLFSMWWWYIGENLPGSWCLQLQWAAEGRTSWHMEEVLLPKASP